MKVAMIGTWNTKCGIAEYTKYFVDSVLSPAVSFQIWPAKTSETVTDDERVAERVWAPKEDPQRLIEAVALSRPDIIHIQYSVNFYYTSTIARLIWCTRRFAKTIVTCHNTHDFIPENRRQLWTLNKAHFVVHQESDKQNLIKNGINKKRISIIPHGQITVPDRDKAEVRKELKLEPSAPIIGSYGFLMPHKGIYETIKAIMLLKDNYPDILFVACNALYDSDDSRCVFENCKKLIKDQNLQKHVKMFSEFLLPDESLKILQACDICVLPYADTVEGASGAVRFCVASRRPLILTKQLIFNDLGDGAYHIKNNSPQAIASGIEELLKENTYTQYQRAVSAMANRHTWPEVAKEYMKLYGVSYE